MAYEKGTVLILGNEWKQMESMVTIDDANTEENMEGLHDFTFEIPYEDAIKPGIEITILNHDS